MLDPGEKTISADLIYTGQRFVEAASMIWDNAGSIVKIVAGEGASPTTGKRRAVLPGLVNAHSHAFQRVIRGRTEHRTKVSVDSFWTWREAMYRAASRLTPEDIYDASRMAFMEMALSGITTVGEFHYLHHAPDGSAYDDPNLLSKQAVRAARDVGLRIALLRVAYARSGFETEVNSRQTRFLETNPDLFLRNLQQLRSDLVGQKNEAWVGIAPHSVRAVPLDYMKAIIGFAHEQRLPVHMHLAEQPAEVSACIHEYGRSPMTLVETEGLLSDCFTAVHAIHVTPKAIHAFAGSGAMICACPTTERNLGDGVVPIDRFFKDGVRVCLGTDSQTQIDLLEDARELEYHLRLQLGERAVLAPDSDDKSALASRLFDSATISGAESLGAPGGKLASDELADFFTIDLDDPSIGGATSEDLLTAVVFSLLRTAIKDVFVGGKQIVFDGRHAAQEEIVKKFADLQQKLWG
jgi:formimidoylglutamate deiminase